MSKPRKRRRSRAKQASGLPKGAYRLPSGGYVVETRGAPDARGRRLVVCGYRRAEPDLHALANVLVSLARRQAAEDAARSNDDTPERSSTTTSRTVPSRAIAKRTIASRAPADAEPRAGDQFR